MEWGFSMKRVIFCLLLLVLLLPFGTRAEQDGAQGGSSRPSVLFISSYNLSFDTVPMQIKGLREVLTEDDVNLDFEFMDTKRFDTAADKQLFYNTLKYKLSRLRPYDALVVGDDAALLFAMKYRQELFPDVPVVFLGINDPDLAQRAGRLSGFTGSVEYMSYQQNIDLIRQLFPRTRHIVAISDNTLTGQGDQRQFWQSAGQNPTMDYRLINTSTLNQDMLIQILQELPSDSVIIYSSFYEDAEGHSYTINEGARFVVEHAAVPVMRLSTGCMGTGVVGGIVISYEEIGRIAGNTVKDILAGTWPNDIPVRMDSPAYGIFDQKVLERYHIDADQLPQHSQIMNRPQSLYETHREFTIAISALLIVLLVVILILLFSAEHRRRLMNEDYLTGLPNRRWITHCIEWSLERDQPCCVLMFDLDNLKRVNDTMGHAAGDTLLMETAQRLRDVLGRRYTVARLGGDEFVCLINISNVRRIREDCHDLVKAFDEPFFIEKRTISLSASIGVACSPRDGTTVNELMAHSDAAMYAVKSAGKHGYRFFDAALKTRLDREEYIEDLLQDAIKNDGFYIMYQPQFSLKTGKLKGFEALLRLKNNLAGPGEFIPVAERSQVILKIGRILTEMVIAQMAEWKEAGYTVPTVSLNFSNIQLRDFDYPDLVEQLLHRYGIEPSRLAIEVTEGIYLNRTEATRQYMQRFIDMGIRLFMDDFGTGYATINYLLYIQFATMKLDKKLMDQYVESGNHQMISGVIALAHHLGMEVIAEGVEDEAVADMLRQCQCDYIQGYLLGRPMLPGDARQLL